MSILVGIRAQHLNITDERRWRNYVKDSLVEPSISKDVLMNTKIMKPQLLRQLFELGSSYSGELLSLTKVAVQLQDVGNVTTLASYLHLLDECGVWFTEVCRRRCSQIQLNS